MSLRRLSGLGRAMSKTVCIVGAGPSGLVAAKTLLHNAPQGEFRVSIVDAQHDIGGLWPTSVEDTGRQVHPLMVANQSRHTVHFSDLAWDDDVPQLPLGWQVGRYLKRYADRYLHGRDDLELALETRVVRATPKDGQGWDVLLRSARGDEEERTFDYLLVASGFFGRPIVPEGLQAPSDVPVIHSSAYRNLQQLLLPRGAEGMPRSGRNRKILVVGGQMSGVEVAGTIGTHLSAAINSPEAPTIEGIEGYTIHHVIQRPIWIFPLFTSPEPAATAAPFLPLDFASYNLSNRPQPLVNTQGHITEDAAKVLHGIFQTVVGTDQSEFSQHLHITEEMKTKPPYLAVSDWYTELVRSGLITVSQGKVDSMQGTSAILSNGERIDDVAAVVVATGFDPSPCLDFLPPSALEKLHHSPRHLEQPLALAFHGTHHPDVPSLGFVGFYRSPYWGVMQMQARILSRLWSDSAESSNTSLFAQKLAQDGSVQRTLRLRDDPRLSQFPMGDYPFHVQEMAEALGLTLEAPILEGLPGLAHNLKPLDMLTPSRYPDAKDDDQAKEEARLIREGTHQTALAGLTTPKFVARAVFRSLLGTWKLERDLVSRLPSHPTGHFSGTARFLLRDKTSEGLQCAKDSSSVLPSSTSGFEYLYIEEGEFTTNGFSFKATRRYVWRYDDDADKLSVWFTKPEDDKRADYLFHEVEFEQPAEGKRTEAAGWRATSGHLCIDDYYDVEYRFRFQAVNLREWNIGYTVKGPKKDYTIRGTYTR